jgi:phenylacetate-CoA ligase
VIEQLKKDTFIIYYVSHNPLSSDKINTIKKEMAFYLEKGLTIIFERQEGLQRSKSGKLKQFTSVLNQT